MNPINLRLTFTDGSTREVSSTVPDFIKFEEKFDKSIADFQKGVKLTWMLFLAWAAETRTKVTSLDFDAYVETVAGIDVGEVKK